MIISTCVITAALVAFAAMDGPVNNGSRDECMKCHTDRERLMALTANMPVGDAASCGADPGEG